MYNTIAENDSLKLELIVAGIEIKKDPFVYKPNLECEVKYSDFLTV